MSAIPYSTAKHISDQLAWPNKFYWSAFQSLARGISPDPALDRNWFRTHGGGYAVFCTKLRPSRGNPSSQIRARKLDHTFYII